jgi:DnaJ-class molecular chaperone
MSGLPASNTTEHGLSISETVGPGVSGKRLGLAVSVDVRRCEACRGKSCVYNSRLKVWIVCSVCRGSGTIDDRPPQSPDWYADYAPSDVALVPPAG